MSRIVVGLVIAASVVAGGPTRGEEATPAPPQRPFSWVSIDFAPYAEGGKSKGADYAALIRLIQRYLAPDSWETSGGQGRILAVDGKLMVYQQPQVHLEIGRFTIVLKSAQKVSHPGPASAGRSRFASVTIDPFPYGDKRPGAPYPLVYPVGDLPQELSFATDRDPVGGAPEKRPLVELLKSVFPTDRREDHGEAATTLELPAVGCVIIVQTEPEHRRLVEFLNALRKVRYEAGEIPSQTERIIEYELFDSEGNALTPERLRLVAVRIQTEMRELDWDRPNRFVIAHKELKILQTNAAHHAIYQKLLEWKIAPLAYPRLGPPPAK